MTQMADRQKKVSGKQPDARTKNASKGKAQVAAKPRESYRESVEAIVVAFIFALLVRGFAAEAFVIPTGSMAPTLMGRHKEVECPECGATFLINAADETRINGNAVRFGTCYNCRYRVDLSQDTSYNGDRILVMKFPYELPWLPLAGPPERWDVVVFHYPEAPEQNYIKRLVGLPGEELMISGGDLFSRPLGSDEPFSILRKPYRHEQAMLVTVYDDRHRPETLKQLKGWQRWASAEADRWVESKEEPGIFQVQSTVGDEPARLEYRHIVPDIQQWWMLLNGRKPPMGPTPSLIDDFSSYNSNQEDDDKPPILEPHWVGDLQIEFRTEWEAIKGMMAIELIEGGIEHRAVLDFGQGTVTVQRDGEILSKPVSFNFKPGRHRIVFSNIDDRLRLRIDRTDVLGDGVEYQANHEQLDAPTVADLTPVAIESNGASMSVSDLVVSRDIYYTLMPNESDLLSQGQIRTLSDLDRMLQNLSTPDRFERLVDQDPPRIFPIREGRYMLMGDNSPRSKDGRAWNKLDIDGGGDRDDKGNLWEYPAWSTFDREAHEVPEELVIGKAFFVYWPHGKPILGLPIRPYVQRMKLIR